MDEKLIKALDKSTQTFLAKYESEPFFASLFNAPIQNPLRSESLSLLGCELLCLKLNKETARIEWKVCEMYEYKDSDKKKKHIYSRKKSLRKPSQRTEKEGI